MVLKKYAEFDGRSQRAEYWYFFLLNILISIALSIVGNMLDLKIIGSIYSLAVFIPSIAVGVRRLHDIGKSGWMILISLIPLIGWIWLIVLFATDSTPGANEYGPNPKETPAVA